MSTSSPAGDAASSAPLPPKVQKTIITFKSDLRKSSFDNRPVSGVVHATRSSSSTPGISNDGGGGSGGREEHSFAWVADYDHVESAISHLEKFGFVRKNCHFIPFSSKRNWVTKYPHAFPYVDCDEGGTVSGFPYWSPQANSQLDIPPEVVHVAAEASTATAISIPAGTNKRIKQDLVSPAGGAPGAKRPGYGNRLGSDALLSNSERCVLHNEIYNYFSWLSDRVAELERNDAGRRTVKRADLSSSGLRGLLVKLESTFRSVSQLKNRKLAQGKTPEDEAKYPLLEESLLSEIASLTAVEEENKKVHRAKVKSEAAERKKNAHWEPLDFEVMFQKLVAYKEEHGHPNVPVKYPQDLQLGSWVSGLRTKKKAYDRALRDGSYLDEAEGGWNPEGGEQAEGGEGEDGKPSSAAQASQKYLNPTRVAALEAIGFAWSMARPKSKPRSWDERLEELRQWHEDNGTWKVPRPTSLGEWLHNQRTLYGKRDTKFMTRKAPRMEAIGYQFNLRESAAVSWDDRFQQLVEFHRLNGHFEVPVPTNEEVDTNGEYGNSDDAEERYRFYKWVNRLHNEYRAYEKGTSSKLNEERVEKLRSIGFQFKGPKSRGRPSTGNVVPVPNLPWEKRIQQMESFKNDTGHLNIDHNYKHCSNLGGWAAEMSTLYKSWKSGSQQLSEDMIAKFDQLATLGFGFDVLPYYENNRSWDDHYAVLLKFKEENDGSARVPLKYKADLRLGKWVQSQRQQYKLLQEGKKSKLTSERMERLEAAGFEWALTTPGVPGVPGGEEIMDEDHV